MGLGPGAGLRLPSLNWKEHGQAVYIDIWPNICKRLTDIIKSKGCKIKF